jgi:hypothetical protein
MRKNRDPVVGMKFQMLSDEFVDQRRFSRTTRAGDPSCRRFTA